MVWLGLLFLALGAPQASIYLVVSPVFPCKHIYGTMRRYSFQGIHLYHLLIRRIFCFFFFFFYYLPWDQSGYHYKEGAWLFYRGNISWVPGLDTPVWLLRERLRDIDRFLVTAGGEGGLTA